MIIYLKHAAEEYIVDVNFNCYKKCTKIMAKWSNIKTIIDQYNNVLAQNSINWPQSVEGSNS